MAITHFDQEEQREIREIIGGTPIEEMPEVESFTDSDLVPFIKVTGDNASPVKSAAVIKATSIGGGSGSGEVTGVKGDSESSYRKGNVNITKANIGLGNVDDKSSATLKGEIMTGANVKTALGCQQGGTKYLKEDGSWDTPAGGGGVEQIQSDWNQTKTSAKDYIKNKPTSMPANGGNAATVNNHSVEKDVPSDAVFTDHTYSVMGASGSTHASGLVPDTPTTAGTSKFLREDGQWAEPQDGSNIADVNYDANNKKITKTIDGVTSDVVTVATLKTDMNLGNVGNFKAVSTEASQGLTDTEKGNARTNIGAGTSSFSGSYNDLTNKPTIPQSVIVDTELSGISPNPVQNRVIKTSLDTMASNVSQALDNSEDAIGRAEEVRAELNAKQLEVGAVQTDSEPTKNSTNFVNSGAIFDYIARFAGETEAGGFKMPITDAAGNLVFGLDKDDIMKFFTKVEMKQLTVERLIDLSENKSKAYMRNLDKEEFMTNDALYDLDYNLRNSSPVRSKRFQIIISTDSHLYPESFSNAIDIATDQKSVDAIIHLGDFTNWLNPEDDYYGNYQEIIGKDKKPLFMTAGNHDVGTRSSYVRYCKDDYTIYERYIKPSVDKGFLKSGEYEDGKCYYYHDFEDYGVRLIMLYPYDSGEEFDEYYWEHVVFNGNYPDIEEKTYYANDYINVPGFTRYSFKCVRQVTVQTAAVSMGTAWEYENGNKVDYHLEYNPRFKTVRYYSWYGQTQLNWFVDKLKGAQTLGYTVIVAQHYPCVFGGYNLNGSDSKFGCTYATDTRYNNPYRGNSCEFETRYTSEDRNIIAQIVSRFVLGGSISKTVYPYGKSNPSERKSDVEIYGLDDASNINPVVLNYSFNGGGRVVFINGHNHSDCITRTSASYGSMTQIGFLCGTLFETFNCDVIRNPSNKKSFDTCTAFTLDGNKIHLTRLGVDTTIRVDSNNRLVKKDNEVITF